MLYLVSRAVVLDLGCCVVCCVLYLVSRAVVVDLGCLPSVAERKLDAGGGGAGQLPHFEHPLHATRQQKIKRHLKQPLYLPLSM